MKQLLATLTLFGVIGCGGELPQQGIISMDIPVVDPNAPASIAAWEASVYNYGSTKISVVTLRLAYGLLGNSTSKKPQLVPIQVCDAKVNGITPEQQSAIDDFVQNELPIHVSIRDAIYKYYQESYPIYKESWSLGTTLFGGANEIEDILPEISSGNELDAIVSWGTIYVHPPISGKALIGIDFIVPWDEEHGIGLQLDGNEVVTIGAAYEAFPVPTR